MAKELVVFADIDGTQKFAPPHLNTTLNLLRGNLNIPQSNQPLETTEAKRIKIDEFAVRLLHRLCPFTEDSRLGLELLKQTVSESGINVRFAVLTGRGPSLHEMTRRSLESSGRGGYFDEVYLNDMASASEYKEFVGRREIEKGNSATLFDDDLVVALKFAGLRAKCQAEQSISVYLLRNISNLSWFLERGHVVLPDNIHLVSSFQVGARDLATRIREGVI